MASQGQSIREQRRDQFYPTLDPLEIERVRRFGNARSFAAGESLWTVGQVAPGLMVILEGRVMVTERDQFGNHKPIVVHGPGNFLGELALLSGRPALVQDTGWSAHLPPGEGLLAFSTPEEALAGIDRINSDYPRHARRAAEIAREHFDAGRILPRLLDVACS